MSEEELSEEQLRELRADLVRNKGAAEAALGSLAEGARPVDLDEPIGRLSRMDAIQQQKMSSANKASAERTLLQIEAALRALDEGEYGFCRRCDEPIGYRRLKARPETPLCVGCQGAAERSA